MDGKSLHYGAVGAISGKLHLLLMCLFSTAMLRLQTFSQIMPVSQTSIMLSYPLSEVSSGHWHHKSHESRTTRSLFGNNPRNTVNIYTSANARISSRGLNKSLFFFFFCFCFCMSSWFITNNPRVNAGIWHSVQKTADCFYYHICMKKQSAVWFVDDEWSWSDIKCHIIIIFSFSLSNQHKKIDKLKVILSNNGKEGNLH